MQESCGMTPYVSCRFLIFLLASAARLSTCPSGCLSAYIAYCSINGTIHALFYATKNSLALSLQATVTKSIQGYRGLEACVFNSYAISLVIWIILICISPRYFPWEIYIFRTPKCFPSIFILSELCISIWFVYHW